tara:strand:- start:663 stop:2081 length:1419 start_codon:yes stop_codon:yes gene_type:complete
MNYKGILFFLGIYSLFISFFSILNILYSIYFNFILDLNSYIFTFIISFFAGAVFCFLGRRYHKNISPADQVVFVILGFIFTPLLISFPYFFSVYDISFLNSYFESVSGITTTGFSVIDQIRNIDEPLLLWRSSSQWLGGLLFLIAITGTIGSKQIKIKPVYLLPGATTGGNFYNNFNYNFIRILIIYFLSTLFVIFLFSLVNIRLLDSVNLSFTTMSSGGFIHTDSLTSIIDSDLRIFVLSIALLFPIFNFYLLFKIFSRQFNLKDHHEDLHLGLAIIILSLFFYFFITPKESIANVFLSIVSSISTSGISVHSSNFDASLFFILLTVVGGSLISTSSGLKYIRLYILLKISYQEIYRLVKPINIFNTNLFNSESKISDEDSKIAFFVFISFIIGIFILSSILTLDSISFEDSFKLSILTLTNTVTSSLYGVENLSFVELKSFTKISLIVFMIFGKIEIITIFYLIIKYILK